MLDVKVRAFPEYHANRKGEVVRLSEAPTPVLGPGEGTGGETLAMGLLSTRMEEEPAGHDFLTIEALGGTVEIVWTPPLLSGAGGILIPQRSGLLCRIALIDPDRLELDDDGSPPNRRHEIATLSQFAVAGWDTPNVLALWWLVLVRRWIMAAPDLVDGIASLPSPYLCLPPEGPCLVRFDECWWRLGRYAVASLCQLERLLARAYFSSAVPYVPQEVS